MTDSERVATEGRPPDAGGSSPDAPATDASATQSVDALRRGLEAQLYFAEPDLATSIFLALRLRRPLLLEGEAGVGKTEVAKAVARLLEGDLVRLQCYEGLDIHSSLYEWDYSRQLLQIRLLEAAGSVDPRQAEKGLYRREMLLARPLLEVLERSRRDRPPPVLLVDELDRADEEFEAFLLEVLSDFQVSIPELGTVRAEVPPVVVLTSNRTREVRDALRRRCLYQWIDYPDADKELRIVRAKVPEVSAGLARRAVEVVQALRAEDLAKAPGVAETLDWLRALETLAIRELDAATVERTLGVLLKHRDDVERLRGERLDRLLG
ncbi:MAG: MoxR family ATPase [Acidobacteriota bacterium]